MVFKAFDYPADLEPYPMHWSKTHDVLAFGHSNLINHAETSNVYIRNDYKNNIKRVYAIRDLKKGEELFVNYECHLSFNPI